MPSEVPSLRPVPGLVELADELRELTEQMLRVPALPADAEQAVAQARQDIRALTRRLAAHAPDDRTPRMGPEPSDQRPYFVSGVVLGDHHPLRPDLEIVHEPGITRGTVHFGVTFEGPPGCVHGGFVSHFFDQVLGQHNLNEHIPAMTGSLTVRYRQATPILTELSFEVRHERDGDRKVRTFGALEADGTVYCEGEGTFIVPRSAHWNPEG